MGRFQLLAILFISNFLFAQKVEFQTLLKDNISIRALQIYDGKVWYAGTDSKFGYVSLKDTADRKLMRVADEKLEFRTLAQNSKYFELINILSPAYLFKIDKKTLKVSLFMTDRKKWAFFDAFMYDRHNRGLAISDPSENGRANPIIILPAGNYQSGDKVVPQYTEYHPGEAHFAASNSNIAMYGSRVWIASGGSKARIFRFHWNKPMKWEAFETPFIQGTSSQGIYSIDFYNRKFGIAVGGDYTKQAENISNIATTQDGGETWQIQASGKNGGYKTCVKFRPQSKGKDIIAIGDSHVDFSQDYGKTWTQLSDRKGLYVCEWVDRNTLVLAGRNQILKMTLQD